MTEQKPDQFKHSDQTHEEMLLKYIEYYNLWDAWAERRSVRTYYAVQRVSKELYQLMKEHNKSLTRDFYRYKRPNPKR
jgi:hypothetical protein